MRKLLREGFNRRYVLLPLLVAITIVVAGFFVAEAGRGYTRDRGEELLERQNRLRAIAEIIYASMDAESAQRGYLLTGERKYFDPYEQARETALALLAGLAQRYEISEVEEVAVLQGVRTRLDIKFDETDQTVQLLQEGRPREALAAVKTDVGLYYMREIRDELEKLRSRELERLYSTLQAWNQGMRVNTLVNAATTGFTVALLMLVGLLVSSEINRRNAAAIELERLVGQRTADLRELSNHMVRITEVEKHALARELHDELGGLLVAMRMDLSQLRRRISLPDADAEMRWNRVNSAIAAGVELKRRVIEELRPTLLDNMGLTAAVRWQAEQSCSQANIALELHLPDEDQEPVLPDDAAIAVFRCAQEALANVLKHARATRVKVSLRHGDGKLRLTVEDDGQGLPAGALTRVGSHGLKEMRFRMQAVGGEMTTEAVVPHGTRVALTLPITPAVSAAG